MNSSTHRVYRFGSFRLNETEQILYKDSEQLDLGLVAVKTLLFLVAHRDRFVTRDELMRAVWSDRAVEGNNLDKQISLIRKVLGKEAIETSTGRGYKFLPEVTNEAEPSPSAPRRPNEPGIAEESAAGVIGTHFFRRWVLLTMASIVVIAFSGWLIVRSSRSRSLTDKDTIVLADFDNSTGLTVLDGTLRQGLASQLAQSPFLNLLPDDRIVEALVLMGLPKTAQVTGERAREICQRTASSITIEGSIKRLGTQYVLWLRVVDCRTGELLAEQQRTVPQLDKVLPALGSAATEIREKLGESQASVQRFDVPLERVTTPSLEALNSYTLGSRTLILRNDSAAAIGFFLRATALDPNFAMAYARLASSFSNAGEAGRSAESIRKAYDLRERVSEREKLYIASHFQHLAVGDLDAARRTYEVWSETFPRDADPLGDLVTVYYALGDYEKALAAAKASLELRPSGLEYGNLVWAYLNTNRLSEAVSAAKKAESNKVDSSFTHLPLYLVAFLQRDKQAMEHHSDAAKGTPGVEDVMLYYQSDTAASAGELKEARKLTESAVTHALHAKEVERAAQYQAEASLREAIVGNVGASKRFAQAALRLSKGRDVVGIAGVALSFSGDSATAKALADDLSKRFPDDTLVKFNYLPMIQAAGFVRGNTQLASRAIEILSATAPVEMGSPAQPVNVAGYPIYLRGEAYLAAQQGRAASIEFNKILDHPGAHINEPIGVLAHLGLARAYRVLGEKERAYAEYKQFLVLWKNADVETPILKNAKAEFAGLGAVM